MCDPPLFCDSCLATVNVFSNKQVSENNLDEMVKITEEMVRRKSEHNEKEITTLEELSLHQEDIEKIEHIQNWCRDLQILLLQSNLISRIENLGKLKKLQYLNLALNNIERIENLEKLESLEKLDLTLNFVGELSSIHNLRGNYNLKYLFLTGNPCTDYKNYRKYVITVLPQLRELDSVYVEKSERILASQNFDELEKCIHSQQEKYLLDRLHERKAGVLRDGNDLDEDETGIETETEMTEEEIRAFWDAPSKNTPEDRILIAKKSKKIREQGKGNAEKKEKPKEAKLFAKDGRPLNINQAKIPFTMFDDDETGCKVLDVAVYRYLDSTLIDIDLHPNYVTLNIKGKILQLSFEEEVAVDRSTCQRSQTTGHLVIRMAKTNHVIRPKSVDEKSRSKEKDIIPQPTGIPTKRELLEIGPPSNEMDFSRIIDAIGENTKPVFKSRIQEKSPAPDFVDNDEVPPLE